MYKIMSFVNKHILLLFQPWHHLFCFCLIILDRPLSMTVNWSDKADRHTLFPVLGGKHQSFTIKYDVSFNFFIDALYQVEKHPFISSFVRVFIMNGHWLFEMCFYIYLDDLLVFFPFMLLVCCITLFFITASRYNSHTITFTHLKYTIQCLSVYSQNCASIFTV